MGYNGDMGISFREWIEERKKGFWDMEGGYGGEWWELWGK